MQRRTYICHDIQAFSDNIFMQVFLRFKFNLSSLKSQVVLLQTAHSWANAGVLLGARMHRERVAFETIKVSG